MTIIKPSFGIDIAIHSVILFTFLSILFMTYISKLTKNKFDHEITSNIDKLVKNTIKSDDEKKYIRQIPFDPLIKLYDKESDYVTIQNNWLLTTLTVYIIIMWIVLISAIIFAKNTLGDELDLTSLIKHNVIVFIIIGIFEYLFFVNIAFNYNPIKPSTLITTLFSEIKKMF